MVRPRNPAIRELGPTRTPQKTAPATPTPRHHPWREKLNAPTGAWCSLIQAREGDREARASVSMHLYRCVVLPDQTAELGDELSDIVSMHLQVRGAP